MATRAATTSRPRAKSRARVSAQPDAIPLGELAAIAQGELVGEPSLLIRGAADLESAADGQITLAVNAKYLTNLPRSKASAVIVPRAVTRLDRPSIRADNPYWSFARILAVFAPKYPSPDPLVNPAAHIATSAHLGAQVIVGPLAVIEDGAQIGDHSVIGASSYVGRDVVIGSDSVLHPGVKVLERCRIGARVVIHAGAVVGADGFGFVTVKGRHEKIPQIGIVVIEDDVEIGANSTIDRATTGATRIGAGSKIDNLVMVGHNCDLGPGVLMAAQSGLSGSTKVGANCRFAGQTGTSGHLSIAPGTSVAARGVVTKDIAQAGIISGFPARSHLAEMRMQAILRRLPELLDRLRALEARIEREEKDAAEEPSGAARRPGRGEA